MGEESKKIGVFTLSLSGGGGERIAAELISKFNSKYSLSVLLLNSKVTYDIPPDTNITVMSNFKLYSKNIGNLLLTPYYAYKFYKWCRKYKLEAVISILPRPNWIAGFSKLFGNKTRIISYEVSTPSQYYKRGTLMGSVGLFLTKTLYRKADQVIGNSEGACEDLRVNLKVPNPLCVRNPIDIEFYKTKSREKYDLDLNMTKYTFFCLSRFQYPKDQATIVRALNLMENKNAQVIFSGDGENLQEVKDLANKMELSQRVIFLGYEPNPFAIMGQSNCFVFSSLLEGFPNSLIEAMACGLPIISSDCISGPREIIAPEVPYSKTLTPDGHYYIGEVGLLFNKKDAKGLGKAMDYIIDHPETDKQFQNNFEGVFSKFSYENTTGQIEILL